MESIATSAALPDSRRDTLVTLDSAQRDTLDLFVGQVIDDDEDENTCCGFCCHKKKNDTKSTGWNKRMKGIWAMRGFQTAERPRDETEIHSPPPWAHDEDYSRGKRTIFTSMLRKDLKKHKRKKRRVKREKKVITEEKFDFSDKTTIFGKITGSVMPDPTENIYKDPEFKEQAKLGAQLIDQVTKEPLSKWADRALHVFVHTLFFANLVAEIVDLALEPEYFGFKVTAVCIGVLENLVVWLIFIIMQLPCVKKSEHYELHKKHQQYVENVLAEVMIYPMIILTVVAFSSGKDYNVFINAEDRADVFKWCQMFLLLTDTAYLVITQVLRLRMLYRLLKDIQTNLGTGDELNLTGDWSLAGRIMPRAYFTVIGNIVLFIFLVIMFGAQVHKDNVETEDFGISMQSGVIMVCLLLLPFYSIGMFALVNYFWIMEIVLNINLTIGRQDELQDKLLADESYGKVMEVALSMAKKNIKVSEQKYKIIQTTPRWRKVLYGLTELHILLLLFFYQIVMVAALFVFDGFDTDAKNIAVRVLFGLVMIVVNSHAFVMAIFSNFVLLLLGIGMLFYPIFIMICCTQQLKDEGDEDEEKEEEEEPDPETGIAEDEKKTAGNTTSREVILENYSGDEEDENMDDRNIDNDMGDGDAGRETAHDDGDGSINETVVDRGGTSVNESVDVVFNESDRDNTDLSKAPETDRQSVDSVV